MMDELVNQKNWLISIIPFFVLLVFWSTVLSFPSCTSLEVLPWFTSIPPISDVNSGV